MSLFKSKNELAIPPSARTDGSGRELVRAWSAHGGLQCSLNVGSAGENETIFWGILLSDIARHAANALLEQKSWDRDKTLREIQRVFNEELDAPTADTSGDFLK